MNNQQEAWSFTCDRVLHNAGQDEVFSRLAKPMVDAAIEGYNGTVLAYGQTGAGKTFTMTGATDNFVHRGIIPRAIGYLFKTIQGKPNTAFTVRVSYLELYNEHMYDLLAPGGGGGGGAPAAFGSSTAGGGGGEEMAIIEDGEGNTHVRGLSHVVATSEEEALNLLFEGDTNRIVGSHSLNKASSRSHTIFTLHVESRSRVESTEKVLMSKLNLVDLAGSERVKKTDSTGLTLQEAKYINQSLTFLEQVVVSLGDRRPHIPYRQTKLTNVLKDSIGGNCKTLMVANIWPEEGQLEETISTLRFASRMMRVSNEPTVNVQYDLSALCKKYESDIKQLKEELAMHDALSNRAHIVYDPYTEQERYELNKQVRAFLAGEVDDLPIINLRHIRETFAQFKVILNNVESAALRQLRSHYGSSAPPADAPTTLSIPALVASGGGVGELDNDGFNLGEFAESAKPSNTEALKRRPSGKAPRHKAPRKKRLASDRSRREVLDESLGPDGSGGDGGGGGGGYGHHSHGHHGHHGHGHHSENDSPGGESRKSSRGGDEGGRTTPSGAKGRKKRRKRGRGDHNTSVESSHGQGDGGGGGGGGGDGRDGSMSRHGSSHALHGKMSKTGSSARLTDEGKSGKGGRRRGGAHAAEEMSGGSGGGGGGGGGGGEEGRDGREGDGVEKSGVGGRGGDGGGMGDGEAGDGGVRDGTGGGAGGSAGVGGGMGTSGSLLGGGVGGGAAGSEGGRQFRPPREEAWEDYKGKEGLEINQILTQNKGILKEKRAEMRSAATAVNEAKMAIDGLRKELEAVREARVGALPQLPRDAVVAALGEEDAEGEVEIIDEDEHMLRLELQDAKAAYRDAREVHKVAKADHDYLQKHVSDCRTRLLSDFDEWYVSQFGALPLRPPPSVMDVVAPNDDVLDDGEKWDLEQTARIAKEDPDAVAFYSARMNVQRKKFLGVRSPPRRR